MVDIRAEAKQLWHESAILTFSAWLMLAAFVLSVAGIFLDPRIITGAPAWLKPAKFGISTAIYMATIAWLYRYIHVWRRYLRVAAWTMSLVFILEVAIIDIQAARGTTSHFNNSTPLDRTLFSIMGAGIGILLVTSIGITLALFKQRFEDRAWGWALRLGMLISVLGSAAGGIMVAPTPDQLDLMRHKEPVAIVGAHTVGAPDGGPGLPGVGWSTRHGDLRVPHFFGIHAVQIIPLFAFLFALRRTAVVIMGAASYLGLTSILAWQALRGESVIAPDATTLAALAVWLATTVVALFAAGRAAQPSAAAGY